MLTHQQLVDAIPQALDGVDLPGFVNKQSGKVRELYIDGQERILITTDRVSAFDRVLGVIPFKGQVLNELSAWWFQQTADIIPNQVIAIPDPNVTIAHEAQPLPVEVIVRGYITGVTKTSLWTLYDQGERHPYGISLPDGLHKNDPLPQPIITPTTKAEAGGHDESLTREQILSRGILPKDQWEQVEAAALAIFKRGQTLAQRAGLILVDTKYEFGLINDQVALIDEVHTPDSSRYWEAASYGPGRDPIHYDKEALRQWFAARGYRGDGESPVMPPDLIAEFAAKYITVYERLIGQIFVPGAQPVLQRIADNIARYQTTRK